MGKGKQTYKLPEGWIWTTIGDIGIVQSGGTPSTRNNEFWINEISWITPADLSRYNKKYISKGNRSISKMGLDYSSAKLLPKGTILFSSRAPIGYVAIAKNELATNQGFKNLIPTKSLNSEYVYYYFQTLKAQAEKVASGTTFLELSATSFSKLPFPLAPFQEQQRIVSKIESLFSELDQAENGLQKAKQQLEVYKHALLKSAFEGRLSNPNLTLGDIPKNWKVSKLGIEGKLISGQHRLKTDYNFEQIGVPYFTGPSDFGIYHPIVSKWSDTPKVIVEKDDILITVKGSGLGKLNIVQEKSTIGRQLMGYRFTSGSKKFIYYYFIFQSQKIKALGIGSAIPGIDRESILNIKCPVPPTKEQDQIVKILESRFTLIENLEKSIQKSLKDVLIFKQSVLKKAFEGKLIAQDSTEESVNLLLQRIRIEKSEYLKAQKELDKIKPQKKRQMDKKKTVLEILKESKDPISTQELWTNSIHEGDIESFYSEIKEIYDQLDEIKESTESLLSLKK